MLKDPFIVDDEADDDIRPANYWGTYRDCDQSMVEKEAQLEALAARRAERPDIVNQGNLEARNGTSSSLEASDDNCEGSNWTYWAVPVRVSRH